MRFMVEVPVALGGAAWMGGVSSSCEIDGGCGELVARRRLEDVDQRQSVGGPGSMPLRHGCSGADRGDPSRPVGDQPSRVGVPSLATRRLFDRLVYSQLRAAMRGRVTHACSGGAPYGRSTTARLHRSHRPGGEVLTRGPNTFAGYWRNTSATLAAYDDDGWFRTGTSGTWTTDTSPSPDARRT
jgi:acyl-CoA synthetase (AMP-forming)/AMP-acid ligase II